MKDCIIIGSGVAGLRASIELEKLGFDIAIYTKEASFESNTHYAQGGVAVCLSQKDSFESHIKDTIYAGAGLCNENSVEILVKEGALRVKELIDWGCGFDKNEKGELDFTKEAAHSTNRILHSNGDATGAEIERILLEVARSKNIEINEYYQLFDLIVDNSEIVGAKFIHSKSKTIKIVYAKTIIMATGGYAAIYSYTTNPSFTVGEGITTAFLAGAIVEDMEFVQFHPTALKYKNAPSFLLSESMRGEGAILLNNKGERFMEKYSKQLELAPRDVVARSIFFEMQKTNSSVYLDISHLSSEFVINRFPTIYKECFKYGLDITKEPIEVSPAAHYTMGGIKTNTNCETNINALLACGECACNGVHGANRLASNSILEGLVFGVRAAHSALKHIQKRAFTMENDATIELESKEKDLKSKIQSLKDRIFNDLGIVREISCMENLFECSLASFDSLNKSSYLTNDYKNLLVLAIAISRSAIDRKSSIGAHYCIDTPWAPTDKTHTNLQINDLEKWM